MYIKTIQVRALIYDICENVHTYIYIYISETNISCEEMN